MTSHGQISDQVGLKPTWTGNHLCVLDDDDVVHLLKATVKREGSQSAVAKRYGVDRGTMNSILNGKRRVSGTLLKAFGLRKVYVIDDYEVLSGLGANNLGHDASGQRPSLPRNEGGWQVITNRCISLLTRSAALTLFVIALPGIACAFDPYGTWMRPSTGTQVNFYDCGGKLCAKIVAVKDERRKSKIGTVIITGATKSADNQWKGDLLNADDGKIYTGVVTMPAPNALNLKGCVAFICQGETWTKVK